jgi:hypothetical protein
MDGKILGKVKAENGEAHPPARSGNRKFPDKVYCRSLQAGWPAENKYTKIKDFCQI